MPPVTHDGFGQIDKALGNVVYKGARGAREMLVATVMLPAGEEHAPKHCHFQHYHFHNLVSSFESLLRILCVVEHSVFRRNGGYPTDTPCEGG